MKSNNLTNATAILLACALLPLYSCQKGLDSTRSAGGTGNGTAPSSVTTKPVTAAATSNAGLVAYKNSAHHLFVGFLVDDGSDPVASTNPENSPDSVDFLEFFSGRDATRSDWRAAQAKGTRIVVCHFLSDAYFDGSAKDPATPSSTLTTPTSSSTYDHWAGAMYTQHIVTDSLDGIDLDIESGTIGGEVSAASYGNLIASVARYFGPNSTSAVTKSMGKKPVFFYDTDGSLDGNTLKGTKSNYDYVLFQAYTSGSHYWSGSGTGDFGPLVTGYGADKLIYLVNGDNFTTSTDDVPTQALWSYAQWVVNNKGVGVGAYRMSRDYDHTPVFAASRTAIQIMNPASGSTAGGVVFYQDINYGGTPTSALAKGSYTLSQLQAHGFVNDWASSVTIPSGWTVTMYADDNFSGTSWTLTANTANFVSLSPNANDAVSSVKIQ